MTGYGRKQMLAKTNEIQKLNDYSSTKSKPKTKNKKSIDRRTSKYTRFSVEMSNPSTNSPGGADLALDKDSVAQQSLYRTSDGISSHSVVLKQRRASFNLQPVEQ